MFHEWFDGLGSTLEELWKRFVFAEAVVLIGRFLSDDYLFMNAPITSVHWLLGPCIGACVPRVGVSRRRCRLGTGVVLVLLAIFLGILASSSVSAAFGLRVGSSGQLFCLCILQKFFSS